MARRTQVPDSRGGRTARPRPTSPPPRSSRTTARSPRGRFLIAGVGASAGGLEALQKFCNALPQGTRIAFVLIQHMDPRGSLLREILGRNAALPVVEASDGMAVRPDRIHVIPPNANMTVFGDRLRIVPSPPRRGANMPIDLFLLSLAEEGKERAVGVILSGTGSDGSRGVRAIKAEGGTVFAQDERSAKYPGMPASAVATGCVDFVLPPDEIAREIVRIGGHPYVRVARKEEEEPAVGPAEEIEGIYALLRKTAAVDFAQYKQATLRRRIHRRMLLRKLEALPDYLKVLAGDPRERDALCRDFLINVTSFFRDPEAFDALKAGVLPVLLKDRPGAAPIRIWVPGCSTGEEIFSLAICALESAGPLGIAAPVQIFGTDVNDAAIEKARAGIYPEGIADDVSPERLQRFFLDTGHGYQIGKQIREMCVFARHDIIKDPPFSRMDLVSCRNVLIYLLPAVQKKIVPRFHYALRPEGYLFLGTSESIGVFPELFKLADPKNKIYVRKDALVRPYLDIAGLRHESDVRERDKQAQDSFRSIDALQKEADRIVLSKYAPPGVLVDEAMEILQFRGETGLFLAPAPGPASLNLLRMSRGGIASALRKIMRQAKAEERTVVREGVTAGIGGRKREIALEAIPIRPPPGGALHFMVLFRERGAGREANPAARAGETGGDEAKKGSSETDHVEELERELAETREHLHSAVDEHRNASEALRAAIEELQSNNEELQSTNEELETAKEELQSTNEELTTVNEELMNRNNELGVVNNDLHNFMASADIPVVMVGSDLRIRRFTPSAEKALNVIPTDVGRPVADVNLNLQLPDLDRKILEVMRSPTVLSHELQDRSGRWFHMMVRPYRTADDKIDGAVLSFSDVDRLKRSLDASEALSRYLQEILDTVREPLLVLDGALRVASANRSFCRTFATSAEETTGLRVYDLGSGQWNIPGLRTLLEEVLPENRRFEGFEVEHDFPSIGRKRMVLNARRIEPQGGHEERILLAIEDVTDRNPP